MSTDVGGCFCQSFSILTSQLSFSLLKNEPYRDRTSVSRICSRSFLFGRNNDLANLDTVGHGVEDESRKKVLTELRSNKVKFNGKIEKIIENQDHVSKKLRVRSSE